MEKALTRFAEFAGALAWHRKLISGGLGRSLRFGWIAARSKNHGQTVPVDEATRKSVYPSPERVMVLRISREDGSSETRRVNTLMLAGVGMAVMVIETKRPGYLVRAPKNGWLEISAEVANGCVHA